MDIQEREAFSPDEFAKRHGIGRTTVFAEIKNGRLIRLRACLVLAAWPSARTQSLDKLPNPGTSAPRPRSQSGFRWADQINKEMKYEQCTNRNKRQHFHTSK